MALISSKPLKVVVLIAITALVFTGWRYGIENVYAKVLAAGANPFLSVLKKDTSIEVEKEKSAYQFKVRTVIDGRKGSFPQVFGSILQPFVILLSWQIFLFLSLGWKQALKSLGVNFVVFGLFQIFFLIMLTGYYTSATQKFIFEMLIDTFYVVAIVLVIKDNMLYPVFRK